MTIAPVLCACGRPLHYSDADLQLRIQAMVDMLGETVPIEVRGPAPHAGRYLVQRHYLALHGVKAWELAGLAEEGIVQRET